jgi:carboxypeptidase C (cathepsin A)
MWHGVECRLEAMLFGSTKEGFTLASVRAAGHMVPTFQPERSLVLLLAFLKNTLPPAQIPI